MSKNFELLEQLERTQMVQPPRGISALPSLDARIPAEASYGWARAEALRLVQRVFLVHARKPPQVVIFAGIDHGNGCSGIAAAVAESLATDNPGSVCLVDANFRSPGLASVFGISNHEGLTQALLDGVPVSSLAIPVGNGNLRLVPSGPITADSPTSLNSEGLAMRMMELRVEFQSIIIDAPPLTRYADAIALGTLADGLILVLEANSTRKEAAQAAIASLQSSNIQVLAAVLNKRTFPIPDRVYRWL
jgi:Mrp family chromosome partitioning ATPase